MSEKLDGVRDSFTTNSHYGMLQLDVIEAVVLTAAAVLERLPAIAPAIACGLTVADMPLGKPTETDDGRKADI